MTRSPQSAMRGRYDRKMERTPGHLRRVCCELDPLFLGTYGLAKPRAIHLRRHDWVRSAEADQGNPPLVSMVAGLCRVRPAIGTAAFGRSFSVYLT